MDIFLRTKGWAVGSPFMDEEDAIVKPGARRGPMRSTDWRQRHLSPIGQLGGAVTIPPDRQPPAVSLS